MEKLKIWFWISLLPLLLTVINSATKILASDYNLHFVQWLNPFFLSFYTTNQVLGYDLATQVLATLFSVNATLTLVGVISAIYLSLKMRSLKVKTD